MPEYSQLQTFIRYNPNTLKTDLQKIKEFFCELGFAEELMQNWIKEINWKVEDNGFVYTGCNINANVMNFDDGIELHIRPTVLGMSKAIYSELIDDILIIEVVFYTEEIYNYFNNSYKEWFLPLVNKAMLLFKKYFFDFGIYLTDEVTDMKPLNIYTSNDVDGILLFDMALIPEEYINMYSNIPPNYISEKVEGGVFINRSFE